MDRSRSPQGLAKMLVYVLGRRPDEFGLVPDPEGFVRVKDLLKALHEEDGWRHVNPSHINEVLLSVPEAGLELAEGRIRARNRLGPSTPDPALPKLLYACIRRRAYLHVHTEGIQVSTGAPGVLLAADGEMAARLGRRIDPDPVILTVNVHLLIGSGRTLTPAGEGLFTTDAVPPGTFSGPPLPKEKPDETRAGGGRADAAEPEMMPGSFALDPGRAAGGAHVPESLKRRTEKGKKLDRKRLKKDKWSREKPPWRG
jgi:putative RNA 2'-phosphotransferase